jgi:glycosyltransferase involved in cell wall biosynthesis
MGGTERAAQNFAMAYAANGHKSKVVFTKETGLRNQLLNLSGIETWNYASPLDRAELIDWNPDVVHLHSHGLAMEDVQTLLDLLKPQHVWETNVFSTPSEWEHLIHKSFQLGQWCQWLYVRRHGDSTKACVVPNPVDVSSFSRAGDDQIAEYKSNLNWPQDCVVLGRVGQAFYGKWSPWIIRIFNALRKENSNIRLLLIEPAESIKSLARKSAYSDDIAIQEAVGDDQTLQIIYSAMDIFLHIAEQGESFGMVLAESLLCQTPVITLATPWGDNTQAEVVADGVCGYVAGTPRNFLCLTKLLIDQKQHRRELGLKGRHHVLKNYDSLIVAKNAVFNGLSRHTVNTPLIACPAYKGHDNPSWLTTFFLKMGLLSLLPYSTGYFPWRLFLRSRLRSLKLASSN